MWTALIGPRFVGPGDDAGMVGGSRQARVPHARSEAAEADGPQQVARILVPASAATKETPTAGILSYLISL